MKNLIDRTVVTLADVNKSYGSDSVVSDINFSVRAGECVVLVGHNGAGKTTLIKLMLGLTRPSSGRIEVLGENPAVGKAVAQHRSLGYLPESVALYEAMTGRELLTFFARLKDVADVDCAHLLDLVGLTKAAKQRIGTYSKGMRQRLGLAQAMLGNPRLLFLDEPTTGLDPGLRHQFYALIENLHEAGVTAIISSHALSEVEARADRFIIMKSGVMIASGTLDELFLQAELPVRLKIAVAPGLSNSVAEHLGSRVNIADINDTTLSVSCFNGDKMSLVRRIGELGDLVDDLQIKPPNLDEVYNHFMNRGQI